MPDIFTGCSCLPRSLGQLQHLKYQNRIWWWWRPSDAVLTIKMIRETWSNYNSAVSWIGPVCFWCRVNQVNLD